MPKWTKEELDYLNENWGKRSIPSIAKHLGRSVNAIKIKAQREKLTRHIHRSDKVTFSQFCIAIGKSYS